MIRRVGWTTATTRVSRNDSSGCRYNTGANARAVWASMSPLSSAAGTDTGTGGMCARGPHAAVIPARKSAVYRKAPLHLDLRILKVTFHGGDGCHVLAPSRHIIWRGHAKATSEHV